MNINIKTTNIEMTDAISGYIHKRLEGLEEVMGVKKEEGITMNVEVGKISNHHKSGDIFMAEARTQINGQSLYAKSELSDLYAAIDEMRDMILAEAKRVKEKKRSLIRRGGSRAKAFVKGFFKK
jgi:ribosomal subunit interface protein